MTIRLLDDVNCSPRPWFQAAENGEIVFFSGSVFCGLCPSSCYRFVVYGKPNVVCPSFQVVCPRQLYIFQGELYMFILYYDDIFNQAESFDETLSIISFKTAHLTIRERYVSASRL